MAPLTKTVTSEQEVLNKAKALKASYTSSLRPTLTKAETPKQVKVTKALTSEHVHAMLAHTFRRSSLRSPALVAEGLIH